MATSRTFMSKTTLSQATQQRRLLGKTMPQVAERKTTTSQLLATSTLKISKVVRVAQTIPSDHYTLKAYDSKLVEEVVTNEENGAGATLDITSTANGIDNISATNSELPIDITYYNIDGTKLNAPQPGINIAKMLYADGRVVSRKVKK